MDFSRKQRILAKGVRDFLGVKCPSTAVLSKAAPFSLKLISCKNFKTVLLRH